MGYTLNLGAQLRAIALYAGTHCHPQFGWYSSPVEQNGANTASISGHVDGSPVFLS